MSEHKFVSVGPGRKKPQAETAAKRERRKDENAHKAKRKNVKVGSFCKYPGQYGTFCLHGNIRNNSSARAAVHNKPPPYNIYQYTLCVLTAEYTKTNERDISVKYYVTRKNAQTVESDIRGIIYNIPFAAVFQPLLRNFRNIVHYHK